MIIFILAIQSAASSYIGIDLFDPATTTSGYSYLLITLYASGGSFDTSYGVSVSLSLSPASTLTGTTTCTTSYGACEFNYNVMCKYAGTYTFKASASGYTDGQSTSFTITGTAAINSMTVSASTASPSAYFSLTITVSIYDSASALTTNTCTVGLSESGGATISGTTSSSITGSGTFSIYLTATGSKTIVATCGSVTGNTVINVLSEYLVISSYTPPTTSLTTFSVTVGVYDNSRTTIESARGSYSISLVLVPSGTISGTVTGTSSSGTITFSSLRILSSGTYSIQASSTNIISATSVSTTVTNYVTSITLSSTTTTPTMNFDFTVTATLKSEDNALYAVAVTVTLTDSSSCLAGTTSLSTSTGTATMTIYCTSTGSKSIVATVPASGSYSQVTQTLAITVQSLKLLFGNYSPVPSISLTVFSAIVSVYDFAGSNIETSRGPYTISLGLSPSATTAGTWSGSTTSGVATINSLRIISAGTYTVTATSTGITSVTSSLTITSYLYSITLTSSNLTPSVGFSVTITGTLKNEDASSFTGSCSMTLSDSSSTMSGTTTGSNSGGSVSFSVYFTAVGTKVLSTSCPASGSFPQVSGSVTLTVSTLILKITSFTPPANSLTTFSVTVGVYDNAGVNVETARGPYSITLSLSPTGTFSGTVTGSTSSGTITFSSLRILTWNTFTLTAASTGITSATSSQFTTTNYVHTITLTSSTATPSMNFLFTISVNLYGEDTGTFTGSCTISLTESTSSLGGTLSSAISGGTGSFSIYSSSVGAKSIVATCPASGSNTAKTQTVSVTVQTLILKLSPTTPSISNSLNSFSLTVGVYDNAGTNLETTRGPYTISLSLSPTGSIAGTSSGSTNGGQITFSSLRITSNGSFAVVAASNGITSAQTTSLAVINYVYSITLASTTTTPSVNFDFTITATLKGEDGNAFLRSCTASLSETTNSLAGTTSATTTTGTATFTVYLTKVGTVSIVATCPGEDSSPPVTGSISITAQTLILKITSFSSPANSLTTFSVTVGVYDNAGANVETARGPYSITLSLTPTGTFSGTVTGSTSSGTITFSSLRILTWNTFTLTAASTGITSATSSQFTTTNYVHTITLTSSTATPSMNFLFTISVNLYGEDTGAFTGSCTISLTESTSSLGGTLSSAISGGTGSFSIYSSSVGTKSIVATCPDSGTNTPITQTVSVTVQTLIIKVTTSPTTPTTSITTLTLTAGVYDHSGTTVESSRGPYSLSLSISPTATFSGTTSGTTSSGTLTLSSFRILSAGTFTISASSNGITSGDSSSITVTNYVYSMTLQSSIATPTVNFDFTLTATLLGEDSNAFTGSCTVTLTESTSTLSGDSSKPNSSGTAAFTVYFTAAGSSKTITATCPAYNSYPAVTTTLTLTSVIQTLKIGSFSPIPSTSLDQFSITVGVYDSTGTNIESTRGPYTITIALTTSGTLSGTLSMSTTSGQAVFSSLRILSAGSFYISGSSSGLTSVTTSSSVTITNYVYTITLTSSSSTPSVNFAFVITASLKGEDTNTFTGVCSMTLSESGSTLSGTVSGSVSGGSGTFSVYFTSPGDKTVVATCPSVGSSPAVTANIALTALSLKIILSSFTAPTDSLTVFSITARVCDNAGTNTETLRGPYSLSLALDPTGTTVGSLSASTTSGQVTFSGLRILSANTYTLSISSTNMVAGTTAQFTVVNYAYSIELSSTTTTPSVKFDFTITATVKAEDGNLFPGTCTVGLSTTDSSLVGELSKVTTNSVSSMIVYFTSTGTKTVTATCPASGSSPAVYQTIQLTALIEKITVTLITPLPTLSTDYLSLSVKVYDNSITNIETSRGVYSITLSLSSGSWTGTTSGNTASGILTITNLRILSTGTFTVTASSPSLTSGTSSSFSVTNLIYSIELSSSTLTPTVNFEFTLTATLKGEDGNLFTGTCTTTISETGGSTITGTLSKITTTGTVTYNIYFTTIGDKVVQAACSGVSGSISLTVPTLGLKINSVNPIPANSRNVFEVVVGVYDNSLNTIESLRGPYTVALGLSPTGTFSGVTSKDTSSGVATFSNVRILTAGSFTLQATSTGIATGTLVTTLTITNFVFTVEAVTSSDTPSKNFAFDITVTLKSEDGLVYTPAATVTLTESSGATMTNYSPTNSVNGVATFTIYFQSTGSKTITATCDSISSTPISLNILDQTLQMSLSLTVISNQPANSLDTFSVTVGVYDSAGSLIENSNQNYIITLSLTPSGTLSGVKTLTTVSGTTTFTSLRILSNGSFQITASCATLASIHSSQLTIENFAYSITIESSSVAPSVNFDFTLTVTIKGEDLELFVNSCTLSLTETGGDTIGGTTSLTTSTGTASFTIFFATAGSKIIQATCPASGPSPEVSNTISVTVLSLALKIESVSPIATSSLDVMSIAVSVYNNEKTIIESIRGPYSISLTISPSGSKVGTWVRSTTNGQITFTGLRILSQNTYTLTASSTDLISTNYSPISIVKELYSIELSSDTATPSANFDFIITANFLSEDSSAYDNQCTVSLSGNNLAGTLTKINLAGSLTYNIRVTLSGSHTITAKSLATLKRGEISAQITIPVLADTLKFSSFSTIPSTSIIPFGLTVTVYDNTETNIENSHGPYSITLALDPDGVLNGVKTAQTVNGVATFTNLRILSAGVFNVIASATDMSDGTSDQVTVTNFVFLVTLTIDPIQTVAFPFDVVVDIKGEDLRLYTSAADITLYRVENGAVTEIETLNTDTGVITFVVTEGSIGVKAYKATCEGIEGTGGFTVNEAKLKVISFSTIPSLSTTSFNVNIGVYNQDFSSIENNYGIYTINIALVPNTGVIDGTTSVVSAAGVAVFSGLRILSSGTYSISASSDTIIPTTSQTLTITNFVYSIVAQSKKSKLKAYEQFVLNIELYGEDQKLFVLSADVTISEKNSEDFNGPTLISTSNGIAFRTYYFYTSGNKVLQVTVGDVVAEVNFEVSDLLNPDVKCKKSISSEICSECVTGAILFDGKCTCTLNSEYSYYDRKCVCGDGFSAVGNYCIKCGRYYLASEVSGKFSDDFMTISIIFAIQPEENPPCLDFLMLPSILDPTSFYCIWDDILTLSLHFEKIPQVEGLVIGIDPYNIQKTGSGCSLLAEELDLSITHSASLPSPIASINGPEIVSLSCSTSDLYINIPNSGRDFQYTWASTYSPTNTEITDLFNSLKSTSVIVPLNKLTAGTLSLTVTISSESFQSSSTATKTIQIVSGSYLTIGLSSGNLINIKKSSDLSIKPIIKENCGKSDYTYTWTYLNHDNSLKFSDILLASSDSGCLFIKKNTLEPETSYMFKVTVTDGSATGSATVTVNVESSPLLMKLSRSSGKIGTDMDLIIKSSVIDPDSESSKITYEWSCNEQTTECLDSSGNTLLTEINKYSVSISNSRLRNTAIYVFNLQASTSSKSQKISVQIEIKSGLIGQVYIQKSLEKINTDSALTVMPTVIGLDSSVIGWGVVYGTKFSLPEVYSFFTVPADTLVQGTSYELKISLSESGIVLESTLSFTTNVAPKCDSVSYSSVSSKKIRLFAENCVDGDDSDYPLKYQYGIGVYKSMNWVSSAIYNNEYTTLVQSSATKANIKICDSLSSCSTLSLSLTTRRSLDQTSDDFEADTSDLDSIPSAISYYSNIATSDTIEKMVIKYLLYSSSILIDSNELDLLTDTTYFLCNAQTSLSSSQADSVIESLISILDSIDFSLTDSQALSIYLAIDSIIYLASSKNIRILIYKVRYNWIKDKTPLSEIKFNSDLIVSHIRGLQSDYKNLIIRASKLTLTFPDQFLYKSSNVIDVSFARFYENNSPIFELQVFFSGKYENQTLTLTEPEIYTQQFSDDLILKYENFQFASGSVCESMDFLNWTKSSCEVKSLTADNLKLDIRATTLFRLTKIESSTSMTSICYYIIYGLLFAGFCLILYMAIIDNNIEVVRQKKTFVHLYPFTSLMITQQKPWRLFQALHIVSTQSLLLLLIGGFYKLFPQTGGFLIATTAKSGICLCFSQIYSLISTILVFNSLKYQKIHCFIYFLEGLIIVSSYVGIVIIALKYSDSFIFNWVCGFLLYSTSDIFCIQFIYSLVLSKKNQVQLQVQSHSHNISDEENLSNIDYANVVGHKSDGPTKMNFKGRKEYDSTGLSAKGNENRKERDKDKFRNSLS